MELDLHNIGVYCTGYQSWLGRKNQTALVLISPGNRKEYSFEVLDRDSNKAANVIHAALGGEGERVAFFLPKSYELFTGILGTLKARGIVCPLFSSFGETALLDRMVDAGPRVVFTSLNYLKRLEKIRDRLTTVQTILVTDIEEDLSPTVRSYPRLFSSSAEDFNIGKTTPETPSLLHYTSGSTGKPKGVLHHHRAMETILATGTDVLGLAPGRRYWCTADPAWITGTSYGILAPWGMGVTQVQYTGAFDPETWYRILDAENINIWYTAPTALRMLMQHPAPDREKFRFSTLDHIFSVGEPLNPEVFHWGKKAFGREIHDTWFQTETGAVMIANRPQQAIKPGSMGSPLESIRAEIHSPSGKPLGVGQQGQLCLRAPWPSMFSQYWGRPDAYAAKFRHGYYYTGDLARMDSDGYFWFIGRSDDVINTSGHLVSPFEVENVLLEIPEVADCGAIAAPDETLFECVVVFVKLAPGVVWTKELELSIKHRVARKVGTIAIPREVVVVDNIPKNKSGKIMRRVLKAHYLGSDLGDISTMEEG